MRSWRCDDDRSIASNARELKLDTCLLIMLFGYQGLGSRHHHADFRVRVLYDLIHGNIDAREAPQYVSHGATSVARNDESTHGLHESVVI